MRCSVNDMKNPTVISMPLPAFDLSKDQASIRVHSITLNGITLLLALHHFPAKPSYTILAHAFAGPNGHGASSGPSSDFLCY